MTELQKLLKRLELEEKHYEPCEISAIAVEPSIYNSLGKRLFDFYQKYSVSPDDQREIEALAFVLNSFVLNREQPQKGLLKKLLKR